MLCLIGLCRLPLLFVSSGLHPGELALFYAQLLDVARTFFGEFG